LGGKKPLDKAYPKEINTIGAAIRQRRLDLGLRQRDVAKIVGCDKTSVLNWEKGHTAPQSNKMAMVMKFLGPSSMPEQAVNLDPEHRYKQFPLTSGGGP
jgi:transcriptional regulator with XRE-family HTH domain